MSISATLQGAMAQVNTALASTFLPTGARVFLLKRSEHSGAYSSLGELPSGAFVEFDNNRAESGLFRYATTSSFSDTWAQVTHIGYGVPASSRIEVFEFAEDEKDAIDPTGTSPFFSGRIIKVKNERYTIV